MENLFDNKNIQSLARKIAREFENRNIFPLTSFSRFLEPGTTDQISKNCQKLHGLIIDIISDKATFKKLFNQKQDNWIRSAIWFGTKDDDYDFDLIATHLCAGIIQKQFRKIDDYIGNLDDDSLNKRLHIPTDTNFLVDLFDKRMVLKNHGIIFDEKVLIYPHQFFRRFYSANFVGMPALLRKAYDSGASVKIRLDPSRETDPNNYREIMEFDYWYGPPFSARLLSDNHTSSRTIHRSSGYYCFSYEVQFTIFRTKMMDKSLREFMIEEYCPIELPYDGNSPGVGAKLCIQKFAHACYDQNSNFFNHIDGAVRVFDIEDYKNYFQKIKSGADIDEKVGKRHKLFLVEGEIDENLTKELMTEWFRYNPHIQEYFSGTKIDPLITYQDFERRQLNKLS